MTTPDADEQGISPPDETASHPPPPTAPAGAAYAEPTLTEPVAAGPPTAAPVAETAPIPVVPARGAAAAAAPRAAALESEVTYVPLAVTVGDGFKFGCGFFLAMVLAMLVGFVLLAALFVLTGLLGLNLPLAR